MALKGRTWSDVDKTFVAFINRRIEEDPRKLSLRTIEGLTGIKHGRLGGLLNMTAGVPTLDEFIGLCRLLGLEASAVMRMLETTAEEPNTRADGLDELLDRVAAHPEDFDIAALHDPNAAMERETPRD